MKRFRKRLHSHGISETFSSGFQVNKSGFLSFCAHLQANIFFLTEKNVLGFKILLLYQYSLKFANTSKIVNSYVINHATSFPEMERSKPNADFFQLCCMLLSMKMHTCINEKIKRRRSVLKKGRERRRHQFFLQMRRRQLLVVLLMFLFAQKPISERSVLEKT